MLPPESPEADRSPPRPQRGGRGDSHDSLITRTHRVEALVTRVTLGVLVVFGLGAAVAIVLLLPRGSRAVAAARMAIPIAVIVAGAAAFVLARRGRPRTGTGLVLAVAFVAIVNYAVVGGYGLHTYTLGLFAAMIVVAALVIGPRAALWGAALALATALGLFTLEVLGLVVDPPTIRDIQPINILLAYGLLFVVTGSVLYVFSRTFQETLQATEAQERQFRQLLEVAPVGYVLHREGRVLLANHAAAVAAGYGTRLALAGASVFDLLPAGMHEPVAARLAEARHLVPGGDLPAVEYLRQDPQGRAQRLETRTMCVEMADGPALLTILRDVTSERAATDALARARDQAEAGLQRQTTLLQQTERVARIGGWAFDLRTRQVQYSEEFARICGLEPGRAASPSEILALFPDLARRQFLDRLQGLSSSGAGDLLLDEELPFVTVQGTSRWGRATGTVEFVDGQAVRLWGSLQDLTERHAQARALAEAQRRAELLLETTSDGVHVVDEEGRVVQVNPAFCRMLGYSAAELLGMRVPDWDAQWSEAEIHDEIRSLLGGTRLFETRHRRRDGTIIDVEISATGVEIDGRWLVYNAARDITARKRAEAALAATQTIFDSTDDLVWSVEPSRWALIAFNRAYREYCHRHDGVTVAPGMALLDRMASQAAAHWRELYELALREGEHTTEVEVHGTSEVFLVSFSRLERDGQVLGVAGVGKRITELRDTQRQLEQAVKMEAIGRLAGGVAHDFNNLLTVILGSTEMLLEALTERDPRRERVVQIRGAAERATGLTRQLLALSRRQVLKPRAVDLGAVVRDMENLLRRVIGEDVRLETALAPGLPPVWADPGQMEQVLMNLAVNARDAMPGGGTLTIQTAEREISTEEAQRAAGTVPGRVVRLTVRDTGSGIPEAIRARIFEPFFTTKEAEHGTGLGLSTVYGIVAQSDGRITVESEVGVGTVFHIDMPATATEAVPAAPLGARPGGPRRGTETILVVEDDGDVRRLTSDILTSVGYRVLVATAGSEALALMRERPPVGIDLLLSDVVMPGMSGVELARAAREGRPGLRVLLMSGYPAETMARSGLVDDEFGFITKPFTAAGLTTRIREALDARSRPVPPPAPGR